MTGEFGTNQRKETPKTAPDIAELKAIIERMDQAAFDKFIHALSIEKRVMLDRAIKNNRASRSSSF